MGGSVGGEGLICRLLTINEAPHSMLKMISLFQKSYVINGFSHDVTYIIKDQWHDLVQLLATYAFCTCFLKKQSA